KGAGDGEQAGQRRVQGPIQKQRARGEGIGLRVDEMDQQTTHTSSPSAHSTAALSSCVGQARAYPNSHSLLPFTACGSPVPSLHVANAALEALDNGWLARPITLNASAARYGSGFPGWCLPRYGSRSNWRIISVPLSTSFPLRAASSFALA